MSDEMPMDCPDCGATFKWSNLGGDGAGAWCHDVPLHIDFDCCMEDVDLRRYQVASWNRICRGAGRAKKQGSR